jgi:hypothetical protein
MNVNATTLSLTALRIMTLNIKGLYVTLSITMLCHYAECRIFFWYAKCCHAEFHFTECHYAVCHYTECPYPECRYAEYRST